MIYLSLSTSGTIVHIVWIALVTFDHTKHIFTSPKFQSVVADAINFFIATPVQSLPPPTQFAGVGVYSIYYTGALPIYASIPNLTKPTCILPIYVGKAVTAGWRTGRSIATGQTPELFRRLREHARSIEQTSNLDVRDFQCRFMLLSGNEADLISTVESVLIRRYIPLWNTVVDGFGNHDPGKGRYNQSPSEWDVLHPGRSWATRLMGTPPDVNQIKQNVHNYIPPVSLP
jgi:hypothetical protein